MLQMSGMAFGDKPTPEVPCVLCPCSCECSHKLPPIWTGKTQQHQPGARPLPLSRPTSLSYYHKEDDPVEKARCWWTVVGGSFSCWKVQGQPVYAMPHAHPPWRGGGGYFISRRGGFSCPPSRACRDQRKSGEGCENQCFRHTLMRPPGSDWSCI